MRLNRLTKSLTRSLMREKDNIMDNKRWSRLHDEKERLESEIEALVNKLSSKEVELVEVNQDLDDFNIEK